jgi:hypothetical protein
MQWGQTMLPLTLTLRIANWFIPSEYGTWTDDFGLRLE